MLKKMLTVLVLLTPVVAYASKANEPIAIILSIEGIGQVAPYNTEYKSNSQIGMSLFHGDTLSTDNDSEITLLFSDDTTLVVKENNSITFNSFQENSGINKFIMGFWSSLRSKFIETEKSVLDSNIVGSIRGVSNDEIIIINKKLSTEDSLEMKGILTSLNNELDDDYTRSLYESIILESYGQYKDSEQILLECMVLDSENELAYDSIIDLYYQHNLFDKLDLVKESKKERSW